MTGSETQGPTLALADSHDLIRVLGARENNLKDVSVEIPKRRLTVFTDVSGPHRIPPGRPEGPDPSEPPRDCQGNGGAVP